MHIDKKKVVKQVGVVHGHAEILVASDNVRIPKHSYLQAFVVKHAEYIM